MPPELSGLEGREFDVVVIGAGVNGASAAHHLAAAGYDVLLVDKDDFASGSSARSSRLLHCGLRYLAPGRSLFDFVRHPSRFATALRMAGLAMEARSQFVKTTPERVQAFRLHFPIWRGGPYRSWQIDAAFALLSRLGPADPPLDYERLRPDQVRGRPLIGRLRDPERLEGVASFREYQFHWPERVTVDAVVDAERLGAVARNHTEARLVRHEPGRGWTLALADRLGASPPVTVRARTVLAMAGIWIDDLLRRTKPTAGRKVFGTKGCHIVVRLPEECRGLGIATLNSVGEPFYCLPWNDLHYFGPTETAYDGNPDEIRVTAEEAAFLLGEANRLLPGLGLTPGHVRFTWAGVRPLTYDPAVPFGNRSRKIHDLGSDGLPDVFAMTAGPVMTHRSAGRELTSLVAGRLSPRRAPGEPDYGPKPVDAPGLHHAATLSDVLFRRWGTAWSGPLAEADLHGLAARAGEALGWTESRRESEMENFRAEWDRLFAPEAGGRPHHEEGAAASRNPAWAPEAATGR